MTYSGHLEEIIGVRWTIISGASIMSAGVMLTSISIRVSIKQKYLTILFLLSSEVLFEAFNLFYFSPTHDVF